MHIEDIISNFREKFPYYFNASLWMLPFLSCILGFQLLKWISGSQTVKTPSVLGMQLSDAVKIFSDASLNIRILKENEDNSLLPGTVIRQSPAPDVKIKKQQSVFLVVTKHTPQSSAPDIVGVQIAKAEILAQDKKFKIKTFPIQSHYPKETIIAQLPSPGKIDVRNTLISYVSSGSARWRVMPLLVGQELDIVKELFEQQNIQFTVERLDNNQDQHMFNEQSSLIMSQLPQSGSVIDSAHWPRVILTVS